VERQEKIKEKINKMQNSISYWQHYLLEDIEEVSYKKSGLKNPDKADRDKDQDISSWEKKVGAAIEKNMGEGDDHSQKADAAIDASQKKFIQKIYKDTPIEKIPKKHRWAFDDKSIKRENFVSKVDMKELELELARLKRENPGKRISYDFITSLKYPKGYVIKIDGKIPDEKSIDISKVMKEEDQDHIKTRVGAIVFKKTGNTNGSKVEYQPYSLIDKKNVDTAFYYHPEDIQQRADDYTVPKRGTISTQFESEDHEVSMANNSIETIIKAAMELKTKLGEDEKDIPAWIQDHISKAENYITQASQNYHEYSSEERGEEKTDDEIDAASLENLMEKIIKSNKK
jgi:hypothetical protein